MHIRPQHNKRAAAVVAAAEGVDPLQSSTAIVQTNGVAGTLVIDNDATALGPSVTPTLAPVTITTTNTPAPTLTNTASTETTTAAVSSASHAPSLTTVVVACIGAFIGAAVLIVSAIYVFKQYNRKQEVNARRRRAARVADDRSWSNLEKPGPGTAPGQPSNGNLDAGEKINMFQAVSPSLRSEYTIAGSDEKSSDGHEGSSAALAAKFTGAGSMPPRLPAARIEDSQPISWGEDSDHSFLTLRSMRMSGSMSPSLGFAKQTPPATSHGAYHSILHQGESAVVVNPFADVHATEMEREVAAGVSKPDRAIHRLSRKGENPFFSGGRSGSIGNGRHRSASNGSGNGRGTSSADPFADVYAAKARALGHRPNMASDGSSNASEAAMQSLIAALDLPENEQDERLRIVSLQPSSYSVMSGAPSMMGYDDAEEVVLPEQFPLPPGSPGHMSR